MIGLSCVETNINKAYTYLADIVGILQSTFPIQSCRVVDIDGHAVNDLVHCQWP